MPGDALTATLIAVARVMQNARDPWWVIGSAAVLLLGGETTVADVDVLFGNCDAEMIDTRLGLGLTAGSGSDLFRSRRYGCWTDPPVPVEFMVDLHLRDDAGWTALVPETRMAVPVGTAILYLPERVEMIAILTRFGRPKDMNRAALLR